MASTPEAGEDVKLGLAAEILRRGSSVQMKAWGTSMLPSVWPGDLLTVESAAHDEIVPGEIVLVLCDKRFFVHRLVEGLREHDSILWITRGDAMPGNDPPAAESELLGRVTGIQRGDRSFVPGRRVALLHSGLGWMLCRWARLRNLALRVHAVRLQTGTSHRISYP